MKISNTVMWVVGAALAVGCSKSSEQREAETARSEPETARSESETEVMTPSAGTRPAAEQLADARCGREERCGNIGTGETYSSSADCRSRIRSEWKDDLNARECPGGINQQQLDECLVQVRAEACGNPFDTLSRVTECTAAQICIEDPQR